MNDRDLIMSQIRQRLEILYQMVEELETSGGSGDAYTKAQTDSLLALKADKSSTYTKTQTDSLLSAKADTSYVNTVKDTADTANTLAVDNRAALVNIVDEGAKNALNHTAYTRTVNGVIYTVNADRTITVTSDGTNAQSLLYLIQNYTGLPAGKYVLSGCTGGSSTTYDIRVKVGNTTYINYDDGTEFTYNGTDTIESSIVVRAGQTLNITMKPMICLKDEWDISKKYQPYRPTYQEVSEKTDTAFNYLFDPGTALESNANLNDYNYACKVCAGTGAIAATIQNTPWTASGFMVVTIPFITTSSFLQFLYPNTSGGKWYKRRYTTSAWGNWIEYDGTTTT